MLKRICKLVLIWVWLATGWAHGEPYIPPTQIPDFAKEQRSLATQISTKPKSARTKTEWVQLALLNVVEAERIGVAHEEATSSLQLTLADAARAYPQDPELQSLVGTLQCMKAGVRGIEGVTAGALFRSGYRKLDDVIRGNPMYLGARLQRGIVSLRAPDFLEKEQAAIADLSFIADKLPKDKTYQGTYAMVLYLLGQAHEKAGNHSAAVARMRDAVAQSTAPWSDLAKQAMR